MATEDKTCPEENAETQIVISDHAASCMLSSFSDSTIGKIVLDTTRANQMFSLEGTEKITIDSEFLGSYMTIIKNRFPSNTPLTMLITFIEPEI